MDTTRPAYLFQRYFNKTATEEEKAELMEWIRRQGKKEDLKAWMDKAWEDFHGNGVVFTEEQSEKMLHRILQERENVITRDEFISENKHLHRYRKIAVAAVIAALIGTGYLWLTSTKRKAENISDITPIENDVAPGGNKAVLTLANGATITLDSVHNGAIARQGNVKVMKLNNGLLAYSRRAIDNRQPAPVQYNTLSTPRGGQYEIRLPDGSKVWLNAASSLKFPAAFTGKERKVALKGEAYFEVAKDRDKPFSVEVLMGRPGQEMTVQVLGTHFDVKAYKDEPAVQTTLLEGVVKVVRGDEGRLLRPHQQANVNLKKQGIKITKANIEDVIAWKNGFFHFDGDDMGTIMRKIERWYDVKVIYKKDIPAGHYTGIISRHTNLSQVLKMLELSGVHFSLKGREITVIS